MARSGVVCAVAVATILASIVISTGASIPCTSDKCAGRWQECGMGGVPKKECCDEGFFCYLLAEPGVGYMQCRRPNSVKTGWVIPPIDCVPGGGGPDIKCAADEDDHPVKVKIGSHFTIATTTTQNPDKAFCEVLNGMAPQLPLSGTVFASATDITRTLKCTVEKDGEKAMCQFDVTLFGKPNIEPGGFAKASAQGPPSAPPPPPEVVFFIE